MAKRDFINDFLRHPKIAATASRIPKAISRKNLKTVSQSRFLRQESQLSKGRAGACTLVYDKRPKLVLSIAIPTQTISIIRFIKIYNISIITI